MFVLFIGCVFQFGLIKGSLSNHMQPQQLELSLNNVNKLLANLDDEIAVERELLSQIDETDAVTVPVNYKTNLNPKMPEFIQTEQELKELPFIRDRIYSPRPGNINMTWQPRDMLTWTTKKDKTIVPDLPVLEKELAFEDPFLESIYPVSPVSTITQLKTTVTQATNIEINLLKHPIRKSMVNFMKEEGVKYVCAFVKSLFELLTRKTDEDIKVILDAFATTLLRMVNTKELLCAGNMLQGRLRHLATLSSQVSPTTFKKMINAMLVALRYRVITYPDGIDLLKTYDHLFNIEEGNHLLDIIIAADNYNVKTYGKPLAITLAERCLRVFVAPVIRQCGSTQVQLFLDKVNHVYVRRFLSKRSMPHNILNTLIDSNLTSDIPNRRSMSKTYRHVKSEYKKMIRHYILKHPTIFRTFAKHYKQSEERKRRHSKHKNHRNAHHKRHRHRHKHHHERQSKYITSKEVINKTTTHTTKRKPLFRVISMEHKTTKVQKRYNIVEKLSSNINKISPSVLFRRSEKGTEEYTNEKRNISCDLSRESPSPKILFHNNTILEKIIGESSYSDDEIYLKTMLKDAFFHGNHT